VRGASGAVLAAVCRQGQWGQITKHLREIYTAPTVDAAEARFADFEQAWGGTAAIRKIKKHGAAEEDDVDAITAALADDLGAKALAAALQYGTAHQPILVGTLRDDVLPGVHRARSANCCISPPQGRWCFMRRTQRRDQLDADGGPSSSTERFAHCGT
jgi:hypothetical protein